MNFELVDKPPQNQAVIKVMGVGGGGGNAVYHMIKNRVEGVEFICANTDMQALASFDRGIALQLGAGVTKGLGAGANPELGRQAALEDRDKIVDVLSGANMVFITAGMGGGTGTGGAPVVAEAAKELGVLTVAVVTKPFQFENRDKAAEAGIEELSRHVDSLITIPNEKLLKVLGGEVSMVDAFAAANDVLLGAVKGIADLILRPGKINADFADVRTVMQEKGTAMMGTGSAKGAERARLATEAAIRSPLLEDVDVEGAKGVLVNLTAGENLSLQEFNEAGDTVRGFADGDATVVMGMVIDPVLDDELRVTVVATGLEGRRAERPAMTVVPPSGNLDISPLLRKPPEAAGKPAAPGATGRGPGPAEKPAPKPPVKDGPAAENGDLDYLDVPAFLRRQAD